MSTEQIQELKMLFVRYHETEQKIKILLGGKEKAPVVKRKRGEGVMKLIETLMNDNTPRKVADMVRDLTAQGNVVTPISVRSAAKYMVSRGMLVMDNETKVFSKVLREM